MEILIQAGQLILSLSILIVLHEFGHYIPARIFNTRVEKFYLFFDYKFSLFKKKIKDTEWGIGWIPLGGYVKISGMIDESMDTEQMEQEPQEHEFRSKPAWQRLIIMIGGIVVNLILGMIIYAMVLFVWGSDHIAPEDAKYGMAVAPEFEYYGFEDGDKILSVEGKQVEDVTQVNKMILLRGARKIEVQHQNGESETITLKEDAEYEMFESGVFEVFYPRSLALIDSVMPDHPAIEAGFQDGDRVVEAGGVEVTYWDEFVDQVFSNKGNNLDVTVERNGESKLLNVAVDTNGTIGVVRSIDELKEMITEDEYTLMGSIPAGINKAYWTLHDYAAQLKFIFTKKGASSMGGFGAFGKMFRPEWHWQSFWANTALISIILAFMNFLPIPALDGGHIMFLLYEMVSGRKPNQKVLEYAQIAGFIFILALVLYANGNDIYKAITGG